MSLRPCLALLLALAAGDAGAEATNSLAAERSPYLRESAGSPIHWSGWNEAAFARARATDRLVFVSIGYSSCHWCRVMAAESFRDPEVAARLNRAFVSIKVDGEELPAVEQRFLAHLEDLGISPGWPMTFALTPDGGVIWGATYVDRGSLLTTLERLEARWRTDAARVRQLAAARRAASRPAPVAVPASQAFADAVARIAADFDPLHKGFGRGRKFPAAAELDLLREAYYRAGSRDHAEMIVQTALAVAGGGLHDPIDGGLFRYSVSRDWLRPHFEKMLQDQANAARLMCVAHGIEPHAVLRRSAAALLDFALGTFAKPNGLLASALDADSGGIEGGYYLWTQAELGALSPHAADSVAASLRRVDFGGGRLLLVPGGADAPGLSGPALGELRALRGAHGPPRRDEKAITAWNANVVAALAECGAELQIARFEHEAATRLRRLLAVNAPRGQVHRYSLGDEALGSATIDDYAWLLAALVALHDRDGSPEWIERAVAVVAALAALGEGELAMQLEQFAADRSGPSASAILLRSLTQLDRRSPDPALSAAAAKVSAALAPRASAAGSATLAAALHDRESPGPRPVAYAAEGRIRLTASASPAVGSERRLSVTADISPGWHVNSDAPLQDYLRPTRIVASDAKNAAVIYPRSRLLRLGASGDDIAVFDGRARFDVRPPPREPGEPAAPMRLVAELQACNDQYCLRAESIPLLAPAR